MTDDKRTPHNDLCVYFAVHEGSMEDWFHDNDIKFKALESSGYLHKYQLFRAEDKMQVDLAFG